MNNHDLLTTLLPEDFENGLLYSTLPYCTVLYFTLLDSTLLYSTLPYCTVLLYSYSTRLYSTIPTLHPTARGL